MKRMKTSPKLKTTNNLSLIIKIAGGISVAAIMIAAGVFIYTQIGNAEDTQAGVASDTNLNGVNGTAFSGYVQQGDEDIAAQQFGDSIYSIMAWVKPEELELSGIVSKRNEYNNQSSYSLFLMPVDGEMKLVFKINEEDNTFMSAGKLPLNQWTHIAVIFDGTKPMGERKQIFINGQIDNVGPSDYTTIKQHSSAFSIGSLAGVDESAFDGEIDKLKFWYKPLSQTDIEYSLNTTMASYSPKSLDADQMASASE